MSDVAIKAELLGKKYRIGRRQANYRTLRDTIASRTKQALSASASMFTRGNGNPGRNSEILWALKDASFEITAGEVVGIIGRNGAGKSTLLKILSRITEPTSGYAEIQGRVGSLLEVGTGMHHELTGRENVFLNGAILGMRKAEIERRFDEIVAFSGVEKFIDTPVKHYSSGMHLRLAFAVAAHLETEILLVDEVLAVGDAAFHKKSLGKMEEVARAGRTVLFVSHSIPTIQELCQRIIWIDEGTVVADGDSGEVAYSYLNTLSQNSFQYSNREHDLTVSKVVLKNARGDDVNQFRPGEDLSIEIWFTTNRPLVRPHFLLSVQGLYGSCFTANMLLDGQRPMVLEGEGSLVCKFKSIPLLPQTYTIKLGIRTQINEKVGELQEIASFNVVGNLRDYGLEGDFLSLASRSTPVLVPYEWIFPDGSSAVVELKRQIHSDVAACF